MKVLLITDDPQEESILLSVLQMAGFSVTVGQRADIDEGLALESSAELIIVTASFDDPVDAIYHLRVYSEAPLVWVVDGVTERLHAQMVEAGSDHVFTRPLSVRLLVAYGQALLRRSQSPLPSVSSVVSKELGMRSAVRLDPARRTVQVTGRPLQRLSQLEYRLLHTLMLNRGQVIPTETIVEHVWGYSGEGDRSLVRGLINRLRAKIEINPENPHYIRTIARIGYMFSPDDAETW